MSTINFIPDPPRTQFTFYGLSSSAMLQLKQFSKMERDTAEQPGLNSLAERGLCKLTGEFKVDRLEAQSLVSAAYKEGWHEKY